MLLSDVIYNKVNKVMTACHVERGLKKFVMDFVPCACLARFAALVSSAFLRAAALGSTCTQHNRWKDRDYSSATAKS